MTITEKISRAKADYDAVYEAGKNAGGGQGSYDEGYEAGRKAEYDAFWDTAQDYGKRTDYQYAFANVGWTDETFKPKYDMVLKSGYGGTSMFNLSRITNLAEILERQGVTLDTSKCGYMASMFVNSKITRVPTLNLTGAHEISGGISTLFSYCANLETIDKLIITEQLVFSRTFDDCPNLKNLIIEGTLGQNGFDVRWSTKLSKASIESIMAALSTTTSGLTVTLSKTAVNNAFTKDEWEALVSQHTNWTISII